MNKIGKFAMLTLFLVAFPLVSYLYLKKGIIYRKGLINDLKTMTPLNHSIKDIAGNTVSPKNSCIVIANGASKELSIPIYHQFKEARGFKFVSTLTKNEVLNKVEIKDPSVFDKSFFNMDSLSKAYFKTTFSDRVFILVDSLGNVRYTYKNNQEEVKKLVSHITVLLPYYNEKKEGYGRKK